jgi:hypothetical protein
VTRYRSLVGTTVILLGLAAEAAVVLLLAEDLAPLHWALQATFYAVAGIIWVVPAAYVTRWAQRRQL